jgi:hypothetical protein
MLRPVASVQRAQASIWRYDIVHGGIILMPAGAKLLSLARVRGALKLWALVDPEIPKVKRRIHVIPTGGAVDPGWEFAGTSTSGRGANVFHIFLEAP